MIQRTRKKITYGAGGLIVIGLFIFLIYLSVSGSSTQNSPQVSPTPTFAPIIAEETTIIRHKVAEGEDEKVDIVSRLRNPNLGAGVRSYPVVFTLIEPNGTIIKKVTEETYILPGSLQYVISLNVPLERHPLGRVEIQLPQAPTFLALPPVIQSPTFNSFTRERTDRTVGNQTIQEQTGIVKNTSTFAWEKVDVSVIGLSATGSVVATGETSVGALAVGEEREFIANWPKPEQPVVRVIVLATTNIYRDENVIRTIGDPNLLH